MRASGARPLWVAAAVAVSSAGVLAGCEKGVRSRAGRELMHGGAAASASGGVAAPSPTARPGMRYVPKGELVAGTPVDVVPRVASEDLPGERVSLGPFFIDELPYPNEPGAIATTNVTREEAATLCAAKGERLCTELEWERGCKGPSNTAYEEGDEYRPATCGMGLAPELAAKRPTGEQPRCESGFGVREQHGGAWEWTDGEWGRGGRKDLGVLKGGNGAAGEHVARCAHAVAKAPTSKSPTIGFRCCAGVKNEATVVVPQAVLAPLERSMKTAELTAPWLPFATETWGDPGAPFAFVHAFTWHPVANETLVVASGCAPTAPRRRCGLLVGRTLAKEGADAGAPVRVLLQVGTGFEAAEVAEAGEARHLRFKGLDRTSAYLRDFTYEYGRIALGEVRR